MLACIDVGGAVDYEIFNRRFSLMIQDPNGHAMSDPKRPIEQGPVAHHRLVVIPLSTSFTKNETFLSLLTKTLTSTLQKTGRLLFGPSRAARRFEKSTTKRVSESFAADL